jgi:hypothetical protein
VLPEEIVDGAVLIVGIVRQKSSTRSSPTASRSALYFEGA